MKVMLKIFVLLGISTFLLSGCELITEAMLDGNPEEVGTCAYWETETGEEGLLCAECDSTTVDNASDSFCGAELKVRCNSDSDALYGIAFGGKQGIASLFTVTAWQEDDDTTGLTADDFMICHEQSLSLIGKQEYKCTTELKGNGKNGGVTFEAEIKYDPTKNDCVID